MKKIVFALTLVLFSHAVSFAQCNKKVTLTSSKTEYLDSTMVVQKTEDEKSVVELSESEVSISPGNEDHKMTGIINSNTCNWTIPFKEGKSIIKATLSDKSAGDTKNITITIEGKDGKVTLLAEVEEMPDRKIRVQIDTFEEKK